MKIDAIQNGIVIDHITADKGMELYNLLNLDELKVPVAIIKNAQSKKLGKKDIIKIDGDITVDFDAIGYVSPSATVSIIKNSKVFDKKTIELPEKLKDVIKCKNPRCITPTEQELPHFIKRTDKKNKVYRCIYCESKAK